MTLFILLNNKNCKHKLGPTEIRRIRHVSSPFRIVCFICTVCYSAKVILPFSSNWFHPLIIKHYFVFGLFERAHFTFYVKFVFTDSFLKNVITRFNNGFGCQYFFLLYKHTLVYMYMHLYIIFLLVERCFM